MNQPDCPASAHRRFHAVRFAHVAALCAILCWLISNAIARATALLAPLALFVSGQDCPNPDSVRPPASAAALVAPLACALLKVR
ncbi:hypothetical protein M9978_18785 [Sphingomonas sp. MG17]|uniref:Uncharacterized protein n=1 Tax=Sphingomonas tagetis TaxID=2949092 RepID=A0A9X2HKB9_9SPHN|nr:hypothetical protein [Sphingomonas tagetis]MCP3732473.1 hypothetical protein [Sphingomonas tagetis]